MTGLYTLNGFDMFTQYGFCPKPGASNPLLTPRKRKPVYSNNWAETDGEEYDLDAPVKFEDRTFTLMGYITADSEVNFHLKYNALKAMFASTGYLVLGSEELGEDYDVKCFYIGSKEVNSLTRLRNTSKVYMEIEIELRETQSGSGGIGGSVGGGGGAPSVPRVETDPTVPAHVKAITTTDIANWNTPSHSHANKTELDSITATKIAEWNAALQPEDLTGLASETYVDAKVAGIVDTAPETLNTLNELAAALGDDPNFATSIATQLGQKANTASLGTAAFTSIENYIKNQTTEDQPAGFRISGNSIINGKLSGSLILNSSDAIISPWPETVGNIRNTDFYYTTNNNPAGQVTASSLTSEFIASTTSNNTFVNNSYRVRVKGSGGVGSIYNTNIITDSKDYTGSISSFEGLEFRTLANHAGSIGSNYGLWMNTAATDQFRSSPVALTAANTIGLTSLTTLSASLDGSTITGNNVVGANLSTYLQGDSATRVVSTQNIIGILISSGARGAGATAVNAYGIQINNGYSNNSGAVTNAYGLYIADTSHGDVKNYNIWSGGTGLNFLSGKTGIGVENPVEKLEVAGNVKADSIILPEGFEIRTSGVVQGGMLTIGRHTGGGQSPDNSSPSIMFLNGEIHIRGSVYPDTGQMASVNINNNRIPSWNDLLYSFVSYPDEVWYDWWDTVYFDRNMQYYSPDSPGNFTEILPIVEDPQNPQQNWRTATIYHQAANEPTYPTYWKKLGSSLPYNPAKVNIIHAQYFDGKVLFKIDHII